MEKSILKQGYYILEVEDIPGELPTDLSKRERVVYLKAHVEQYRFSNFSGVPFEEIQRLVLIEEEKKNNSYE